MNVTGSTKQLALVGVLAAAVMYFGPVKWALGQTDSLDQQVTATREQTTDLESRVSAAKKAKANEAQYQSELDTFRAAFPAKTNQADLLDLISDTAGSAGVVWKSNAASDPDAKDGAAADASTASSAGDGSGASANTAPAGLTAISLSIEVEGTQDQISKFAAGLRAAPRVLTVDDVNITKQSGDATATARMTVRAFTWPGGERK
ncbi:MAG: type 4a pilus biogenesis protein PilO [Acidimicrobiia bacterium]